MGQKGQAGQGRAILKLHSGSRERQRRELSLKKKKKTVLKIKLPKQFFSSSFFPLPFPTVQCVKVPCCSIHLPELLGTVPVSPQRDIPSNAPAAGVRNKSSRQQRRSSSLGKERPEAHEACVSLAQGCFRCSCLLSTALCANPRDVVKGGSHPAYISHAGMRKLQSEQQPRARCAAH